MPVELILVDDELELQTATQQPVFASTCVVQVAPPSMSAIAGHSGLPNQFQVGLGQSDDVLFPVELLKLEYSLIALDELGLLRMLPSLEPLLLL